MFKLQKIQLTPIFFPSAVAVIMDESGVVEIYRPFGYKMVYLPLCRGADTPSHIQGDDIISNVKSVHPNIVSDINDFQSHEFKMIRYLSFYI